MGSKMEKDSVISNGKAIAGGPAIFDGTEVPVKELHGYMRKDWNLYGFLREFPSVSMEQALAEMERDARETVQKVICVDKDVVGGTPVFHKTYVPVKIMFDYLADVRSLKDFHWDYPKVSRIVTWDVVVTAGRILELDAYRGVENGVVHSAGNSSAGRLYSWTPVCR